MAYGPVNVPGASEAELAAAEQAAGDAKTAAQEASNKVGAANDTGGSTTAGTVMGKLNKLISDLTTHMGRWTAARAGYIDTINTNAKNSADRTGATGDTGGSATAGTVMGKLNKLISDLTAHAASWTAARAGYIDTIKTDAAAAKADAAAAKSNTGTNNTGSATGTLSQKLSHIISLLTSGDVSDKLETIVTQTQDIGAVKSVQRGLVPALTAWSTGSTVNYGVDITINAVSPDKCAVIVQTAGGGNTFNPVACTSLTSTKLHLESGTKGQKASWQVIEFY